MPRRPGQDGGASSATPWWLYRTTPTRPARCGWTPSASPARSRSSSGTTHRWRAAPTRFATERFTLGGAVIEPGDTATLALTSADRDAPVEAGSEPGHLDVLRHHARHVSFGHGIHHCIGAPLARLEATVALRILLQHLPDLEWARPTEDVTWLPAGITRGPVRLPVRPVAVLTRRSTPRRTGGGRSRPRHRLGGCPRAAGFRRRLVDVS